MNQNKQIKLTKLRTIFDFHQKINLARKVAYLSEMSLLCKKFQKRVIFELLLKFTFWIKSILVE